ncbi:MAG: hypothetical protein LQ340_000539 [Diploschistes diacapsis]|nr:MAG: hypothetical protein LQ340_000539 [Diploschistes diacapsis]
MSMLASSNTSKGPLSNRHRISFTSSRFSTASAIQQSLSSELSKCSSDIYVIAQQPGVSLIDYSEVVSTPHLKEWMSSNKRVKSKGHVAEVKGHVEPSALVEQLQRKCGAELLAIDASTGYFDAVVASSNKPQVVTIDFASPFSMGKRGEGLRMNDLFLNNFLDSLPYESKLTVLYTTSSPTAEQSLHVENPATYEMDNSMSSVHMDMKRDLGVASRQANGNITLVDGPLFERYQYFTPGIFMGLFTMFFLLSIGYVGINALQSLQVSYGAFDKENGPAAQRKQ